MKTLITPLRVAGLAFRAPDFIAPEAIPEATILAAEQKFIKPVVGGGLYDALLEGGHGELLEDFIAPALALYVKMSMLPSLAVQAGTVGVIETSSKHLVKAGDVKLRAKVRRLRAEALELMRRAVEHIESRPADYPEYDPRANILNRCSIDGGVVLAR